MRGGGYEIGAGVNLCVCILCSIVSLKFSTVPIFLDFVPIFLDFVPIFLNNVRPKIPLFHGFFPYF